MKRLVLLAALTTTACGPSATFTAVDHADPETGVQVFYAMPDPQGWRQAGTVRVEDAASEWDAERAALALARRHRCDGVYLASVQNPVFTARGVCLVRRALLESAPVAAAGPVATAEPSAPRAVSPVDVQSHLGQQVTLRFADGRHQVGILAGDDGEAVFLRSAGALLRFPAAQLAAVEPAPAP